MSNSDPTREYIEMICNLYGDTYDDRIEDCRPPAAGDSFRTPGSDWVPGQVADHKSLIAFQRELEDKGIKLSSSKIRKILITGGLWSTERSREIAKLYSQYTSPESAGGSGLNPDAAIVKIATELGVSIVTVSVNLPYQNVVYNLENKSSNAKRCARYKERKRKGNKLTDHHHGTLFNSKLRRPRREEFTLHVTGDNPSVSAGAIHDPFRPSWLTPLRTRRLPPPMCPIL